MKKRDPKQNLTRPPGVDVSKIKVDQGGRYEIDDAALGRIAGGLRKADDPTTTNNRCINEKKCKARNDQYCINKESCENL